MDIVLTSHPYFMNVDAFELQEAIAHAPSSCGALAVRVTVPVRADRRDQNQPGSKCARPIFCVPSCSASGDTR